MGTFFTADPHFWHRRICEFAGRPFGSVEDMNAELVRRWNTMVRPEDWVYVLGDVAFQTGRPDSLAIVRELNGVLLLVPGNHDKCHPMYGAKAAGWRDRYLRAGFAEVLPTSVHEIIADQSVILSHFPYEGDSHDGDRFTDWRPVDVDGRTYVIHGHVHGAWLQKGYQINVGMDAWNGYPVPMQAVAARIYAGPTDTQPFRWQAA